MRIITILLLLLPILSLRAQKREEGFDYFFKPTGNYPRFYVVTEKKDSLWQRQAWYLPERSMYLEGWYLDEQAKQPHGVFFYYHTNRGLKATGRYVQGRKEGPWLEFNEDGLLQDSAFYTAGRLRVRVKWNPGGMPVDSMNFDAAGNGIEAGWYGDGAVHFTGRWVNDTAKHGRWNYFYPNGKVWVTQDHYYGKEIASRCFDEAGMPMDSSLCILREAEFPGGSKAWVQFVQRNLRTEVPIRMGAPVGQYQVIVAFTVDKNGQIMDIRPRTKFGFGMEEEVIRMMQKSPKWVPAFQWGRQVKAYRLQPVTFVVSQG